LRENNQQGQRKEEDFYLIEILEIHNFRKKEKKKTKMIILCNIMSIAC